MVDGIGRVSRESDDGLKEVRGVLEDDFDVRVTRSENGHDAAEGIGGEAFELAGCCGFGEGKGFVFLRSQAVDDELAEVAGEAIPFFGEAGDDRGLALSS